MNEYYLKLQKLQGMAYELSKLEYPDEIFNKTERDEIYKEKLKLDLRFINKSFYDTVDIIVKKYLKIRSYSFSAIYANDNCNIHSDVAENKDPKYQRYANLAIPLKINSYGRKTFWPNLTDSHRELIGKQSYLDNVTTEYYINNSLYHSIYDHEELIPVLLNTSIPHGVMSNGYSFFVYITIPNTSYKTCYSLYNSEIFYN